MAQNTGTLVAAAIRPADSNDTFATAFSSEIKGGLHSVESTQDMYNIPIDRREFGMEVFVTRDNISYRLSNSDMGGTGYDLSNNSNWIVVTNGTEFSNLDDVPDSTSRKAVDVGSAPTVPKIGKISYATGFNSAPNTSNQSTWNPQLFYSPDGVRSIPLLPNARLQPNIVRWYGDSFTANFGLASANDGFVNKVSNLMGWAYSNLGVSGSTAAGNYKGLPSSSGEINIVGIGQNDCRLYGLAAIPGYQQLIMGWILSFLSPSNSQAQLFTKSVPSDWSNTNIFFNTTTGIKTTVNNSPVTFTTTGNVVYLNVAYEVGGDATYTVSIDGVSQGTFTANSNAISGYPSPVAGSEDTNYYPFMHRFTGLTRKSHTISIQKTGGTTPLRLISGFSNEVVKNSWGNGASTVYFWPPTYQQTGSTYSGNISGLNDSFFDAYHSAALSVCNRLASDGFHVKYIDVRKSYNPNKAGSVQPDMLHPSAQGCSEIAKAFIDEISLFNHSRSQQAQALVSAVAGNENYIVRFGDATHNRSSIYDDGSGISLGSNIVTRSFNIPYSPLNTFNGWYQPLLPDRSTWFESFLGSSNVYTIGTDATVSGNRYPVLFKASYFTFNPYGVEVVRVSNTSISHSVPLMSNQVFSGSSGETYGMGFYNQTVNTSGTASWRFLKSYIYNQSSGSGGTSFIDIRRSSAPAGGGSLTPLLLGDLITGDITISGKISGLVAGVSGGDAVNKSQLDSSITTLSNNVASSYVPVAGSTSINGTKTFTESPVVPSPTLLAHAASKGYVDSMSVKGKGQSIQSGNGSNTSFTITHGLSGITSGNQLIITPRSTDAFGYNSLTLTSTTITIGYPVAPAAATNNLTFDWIIL